MSDVVTDTHALIWYLSDSPRLSVAANQLFDRCDLALPPLMIAESKTGKIQTKSLDELKKKLGIEQFLT